MRYKIEYSWDVSIYLTTTCVFRNINFVPRPILIFHSIKHAPFSFLKKPPLNKRPSHSLITLKVEVKAANAVNFFLNTSALSLWSSVIEKVRYIIRYPVAGRSFNLDEYSEIVSCLFAGEFKQRGIG